MEINIRIKFERFVEGLCVGFAVGILALVISGMNRYTIIRAIDVPIIQIIVTSYVILIILGSICFSIERIGDSE